MLNYKVIANKPSNGWVVMVHGAGGSIEVWFRQVPDFARHFNLLMVDLAGHVCNVDNKSFFNRASIEFFKQFGRL